MWNLILVCLKTVLVLVQDRCTLCAERTIGSKIILDTPMELLRNVGHVESHFGLFGTVLLSVRLEIVVMLMQDRCTFCAECTIGS
jgi:vacuolar-type H+-ATPase subunit I/STV1